MYLYLITCSSQSPLPEGRGLLAKKDKFKIGITNNPKQRNSIYKEHNLNYKFEGIFKVENKEIEKSIHLSLLKKGYKKLNSYKEWFEGTFSLLQLENEIDEYNKRLKFCKLV
jgi:hypothetical protein